MENVVTKGAKPAEPMSQVAPVTPGQTASWEDLGGPTPENYRSDDDSAKLKDPSATLAQVRDIVNAKAVKAAAVKEETEEDDEDLISEEEILEAAEDEEEGSKKDQKEDKKEYGKKNPSKSEEDDKKKKENEDDCGMKEEYDIEEDVNALLSGEELSEEFQEKARTIFETAIKSKVAEIKEELHDAYAQQLVEEIDFIKSELTERVDAYLEYVADEWISENALAVEAGLKTEMTESFLEGMRGLFEDHYVSIPEDRYDVVYSMVDKLDEMEEKLNEQIERNVLLNRRLAESVADVILSDVSEGLALSQKDKLASLAENVGFESESDYREKLVTLRESYFPSNIASTQKNVTENLSEEVNTVYEEQVSPAMGAYLQMLGRVANK
jgi:hypothetical protein